MVVVLIIAILIAIAIPTFLGARQRAQDKAAQSSLRNGLTAAKTIYTDSEKYGDATPGTTGTLVDTEPSLSYVDGATASNGPKNVSVASTADNLIVMSAESKSGKCFWIRDNTQGPGTEFASGTGTCSASGAPAGGWSANGW